MNPSPPGPPTPTRAPAHLESKLAFRVRYVECDPMGFLHHSHYLPFFEMGRTELLRSHGISYRELEERNILFVVTRILIQYKRPARYDDELELTTRVTKQTHVRIDHAYELHHKAANLLLCTGESTIACINKQGEIQPIPAFLGGKYTAEPMG